MPLLIETNIKIPSFTKEEYEAEKDNIPVNTVFIVTDDSADDKSKSKEE